MRVLASADHHFDQHKRFDECVRIHDWMVDVARREGVDLFLSGGDIYERASTPLERQAVAEWLTRMAEVCPVVIAKGNHDRSYELGLLARLRTRHPVIVEERAAVHHVAGAAVAAVAWSDRAALAASVPGRSDAETVDLAARDALRAVLLGLGQELGQYQGPRIGLGHFMVDGSVVSTGQPLLGMPLNVGLEDLGLLGAELVVCGHIHRAQEWTWGDSRILYPGSPFRTDFGQLEPKGVALATFDGERLAEVTTIKTPATPMVHLDGDWRDIPRSARGMAGLWVEREGLVPRGAEVRLRYTVPADQRDGARADAEDIRQELLTDFGAVSVKLEEVVLPRTRARIPEIARATTLPEKLAALRAARGEVLEAERVARLDRMVAEIQQQETA